MSDRPPLVIVGASARAAAQSAIGAGFDPWCVDLFADRDLARIAPVRRCPRDQYPHGILRLLEDAPRAPVFLTGAMENHPEVLRAIELDRGLWGSSSRAIAAVRDPKTWRKPPAVSGIDWPAVFVSSPWFNLARGLHLCAAGKHPFLLKPVRSAGGAHIQPWTPRVRIDRDHYLQRFVKGQAISAVYHADGWSARMLGVTRQILGDGAFGARGTFQYCGSIGPIELETPARQAMTQLGVVLTQRFDLRGVFGVDAILQHDGTISPVEVNPRYTASVEVIERATGIWALKPKTGRAPSRALHGKAILFAHDSGIVTELYELFPEHQIADVPHPGAPVERGAPICTVFAEGRDETHCLSRLRELAERVYTRIAK